MEIKDLIREARKSRGLTLAEASKKTGLSVSQYSDYEHGRRNPKPEQLVKISRGYGLPDDYFVLELLSHNDY